MALSLKRNTKETAEKYGILPSKRLGQNFLVDYGVVKEEIEATGVGKEDTILEIGPGLGALTRELAGKTKKVIAVEKDRRMVEALKGSFPDSKNLELIQADMLEFDTKKLAPNYKALGNLPFYLTAPLVRKLLEENENRPERMVFIVQKEMARRIVSQPPEMNILAASVQFYAKAKIVSYVSKNSFWPKPKVDAAILEIIPFAERILTKKGAGLFFKIVKAGFSQPRKQLVNNLSKKLKLSKTEVAGWLERNDISPKRRAETLKIEDWLKLTKSSKIKQDGI